MLHQTSTLSTLSQTELPPGAGLPWTLSALQAQQRRWLAGLLCSPGGWLC